MYTTLIFFFFFFYAPYAFVLDFVSAERGEGSIAVLHGCLSFGVDPRVEN